jgi:DNA-binding winged helix-turn-helix (wHTH) protein
MRYRINHSIIYTPDDGAVKLIADSENDVASGEISLAPTANRLLTMLVSHHGSILQRDELLDSVWDAHGLRASNNSLNQYISVLRRNFADLGVEEMVIVTIPTVGFMFSKDIPVATEDSPAHVSVSRPMNSHSEPTGVAMKEGVESEQPEKKSPVIRKGAILSALLLLVAVNVGLFMYMLPKTPQFEPRYLLGAVDTCPVYTFYPTTHINQQKYMELVKKSMARANFHCKPETDIFFKIEDLALEQQQATMFIATCSRRKENKFAGCRSYFTN